MRRSRREDVAFSADVDLSVYSNDELESQLDARREASRQISIERKACTAGAGETGDPTEAFELGKTITALLPLCRVEFVCGLDKQALMAAWCNESCAATPYEKPANCTSCDDGGDRAIGGGGAARCGGAAARALTWAPPGGAGGAGRLAPCIALPGLTAGCCVDIGCVHVAVAVDGLDGIHTSGAVDSSSVSRPGAWSARRARSTVAGSQMLVSMPALRHARRSADMGTGSAIGRFVRLAAPSRRARTTVYCK